MNGTAPLRVAWLGHRSATGADGIITYSREITAGLRDWRSQMPAANVARFEAAAGDLLDSLGYPRGAPQPSVEMLEYVTGIRERFSKDSCSYSLRSSISQP